MLTIYDRELAADPDGNGPFMSVAIQPVIEVFIQEFQKSANEGELDSLDPVDRAEAESIVEALGSQTRNPRPSRAVISWCVSRLDQIVGGSLVIQGGDQLVNAFAAWINEVEQTLCHYFTNPDIDALYHERYWRIASGNPPVTLPRFAESARAEHAWQFNRIISIAEELEGEVARLRGDGEARIAVVDTNVFLHCQPIQDFGDWSFVSTGPVRVVVPVRVIEELDMKKRDRNSDIADRARRSIRWLTKTLVPKHGGPVLLRSEVTLESYTPNGRREIIPSADTEILETCERLEAFAARPVSVVTSDLGMQLRAMNAGVAICVVPDRYRLDLP